MEACGTVSWQFSLEVSLEKAKEVRVELGIISSPRSRPTISPRSIPVQLRDRLPIPQPSLLPLSRGLSCGCQVLSLTSPLLSRKMTPALRVSPASRKPSFSPQELLVVVVAGWPTVVVDAVRVKAPVAVSTLVGFPPLEVAPLSLPAAKGSTGHHGRSALGGINLREPKSLSDH